MDMVRKAELGDLRKMKELLRANAEIKSQETEYGMTALIIATDRSRLRCAQELIRQGADHTVKNFDKTALDRALGQGRGAIVDFFENAAKF